jgi:hypothetical protein
MIAKLAVSLRTLLNELSGIAVVLTHRPLVAFSLHHCCPIVWKNKKTDTPMLTQKGCYQYAQPCVAAELDEAVLGQCRPPQSAGAWRKCHYCLAHYHHSLSIPTILQHP